MEVTLTLEKGEHITFSPDKIVKTISPNSVDIVNVKLQVKGQPVPQKQVKQDEEPEWKKLWDELEDLPVYWEITYDFEKYGKISVKGSAEIY